MAEEFPDEHISRLLHLAADAFDEGNNVLTIEAIDHARAPIVEILKRQGEVRENILKQVQDAQNRRNSTSRI